MVLLRLELTGALAPVRDYTYNPPKPSFEKEGFRGRQFKQYKNKTRCLTNGQTSRFELLIRLELTTSSLPRKCSTTELQQQ